VTSKTVISKVPAISIGMPVYNGEDFIEEAILSLLAQNFRDFELIVSDNASTDRTREIVNRFVLQDTRIRYVRQTENIGAVGNFKYVFKAARAQYFMWAASDDIWAPDWIETLLPVARSSKNLSFGIFQTIDENGDLLPNSANSRRFSYIGSRLWRRLKFFVDPSALGKSNAIYGIFEKSIFSNDVWSEFEIKRNAPDVMALYEILKEHKIVHAGDAYIMKRVHHSNTANDDSFVERSMLRKSRFFRRTQVPDFFRSSNSLERTLIVVLYPLARLGLTWAKIRHISAKHSNTNRDLNK